MAFSNDQYEWCETEPMVWTRSVDEVELFYAALAEQWRGTGRMFFAMTGHISITVDAPVDWCSDMESAVDIALQHAWLALRFDHPTIGARVVRDSRLGGGFTKTYHTLIDAIDQRAWLDQTLVKISTGQTGAEWANSDPPAPVYPTLFVVSPPAVAPSPGSARKRIRRDLVIRSPHDIMDGIGTLMLLNNLPPYRIAAGVPPTPTTAQTARLQALAEEKRSAALGVELLTVPLSSTEVVPGKHQRVAITLPVQETARILAKGRELGATVTHIFHAAIPMAMRDIQDPAAEARRVRYVNYILRNERPSCVYPYSTDLHPASVYHSVSGGSLMVDLTVPRADSAGSSADEQVEEYGRIVSKMKDFYFGVKTDAEHAHIAPSSGLGPIDPIIVPSKGPFEMHDPWVTGEELGTGLGVFLGTYRDRLTLSAAYNDAFHDEAKVQDFLERCKDIVYRGLGI
ncbi:unnamed protein product [Parascedosporium putredinis]|uniref:Uncharacterized protein n=1 Tax=Parascedosporium putredinis TaxID=1442378 RepID=A0A9P1HCH8_9PEZI|nr:unnamed protein product [Parascedosporium putredinis]CAI8004892.1 unnamed protein product [Parascedosporium putredinis]